MRSSDDCSHGCLEPKHNTPSVCMLPSLLTLVASRLVASRLVALPSFARRHEARCVAPRPTAPKRQGQAFAAAFLWPLQSTGSRGTDACVRALNARRDCPCDPMRASTFSKLMPMHHHDSCVYVTCTPYHCTLPPNSSVAATSSLVMPASWAEWPASSTMYSRSASPQAFLRSYAERALGGH